MRTIDWIKEEDFKKILNTLKQELHKNKISIYFDMKKYAKKYEADYHDYKYFKMYENSTKLNNYYITKGLNEKYITEYNKEYEIDVPSKIKTIDRQKLPKQNEELKHINKKTCIFKFLVFNNNIIACILNLQGEKNLYAPINIETGIIDYPSNDLDGNTYEKSPSTKEELLWFRIPKWPRICRYVINNSQYLDNYKYIEINIYLDNNGPQILSINNPEYYVYQLNIDKTKNDNLKNIIEKKE